MESGVETVVRDEGSLSGSQLDMRHIWPGTEQMRDKIVAGS
jgi:hypothetical protein